VLPDLYRDEPVVLSARVTSLTGTLELKGRIGDRPWTVRLPVAKAAPGVGLSKLWARRKITDAEIARTLGQATAEETDRRILALALDHHLVSRLTSLVAVETTPSRPEGARLSRAELPLNLPAGWDFDKVFGERPVVPAPRHDDHAEGADAARTRLAANAARRVTAAPAPRAVTVPIAAQTGVVLPKTATDAELRMILGALMMLASLLLLMLRRLAIGTAG
jgi:Ca-activated chloride channel family protein